MAKLGTAKMLQKSIKNNNFDLIRLVLSSIVLLVHAYVLSGNETLATINIFISSAIAVKSFFVLSGFLIFMSYDNSSSTSYYFKKRLRRIIPAYITVILSTTFIGLIYCSLLGITAYQIIEIGKYFVFNLFFLNFLAPTLPKVFTQNLIPAVNGALWTIKVEVMFYMFVPIIVWSIKKFKLNLTLIILYSSSILYNSLMYLLWHQSGEPLFLELQRQLPGQLTYFIAGASAYYYFTSFLKHSKKLAALAILFFLVKSQFYIQFIEMFLEPIALGVLIIYLATVFPYLGNVKKYGDLSYGIYILHFPVIQLIISMGLFTLHPYLALISATIVTLSLSYLLWHSVEKRFLSAGSYYLSKQNDLKI